MLKIRNKSKGKLKGLKKGGKRVREEKKSEAGPASEPAPRHGPALHHRLQRRLPPPGATTRRSLHPARLVALLSRRCAGLSPSRHCSRASAASRAWSSREGPRAAGRVPSPCLAARGLAGPAPALRSPGPDRKRRRTAWAWRGGRALGPGGTWARSTRSTSRTDTSTRVRNHRPARRAAPPLPARPRPAEILRRGGVRLGPAGPGGCSWGAGRWGASSRSAPSQPAPCSCFRVRGEAPEAGPQSGRERSH